MAITRSLWLSVVVLAVGAVTECGCQGGASAAPALPGGLAVGSIVDTAQTRCYSAAGVMSAPAPGQTFYGQDAQFDGLQPAYRDNGDGTVSDLNTGMMWQQDPGDKVTFAQAVAGADGFSLAGFTDWRLPTIKELYSLTRFDGVTGMSSAGSTPYIDTDYFVFCYGDETGERFIDSQYVSSTQYVSTTMGGNPTVFGVNFADGRIKGYPESDPRGGQKLFYCMHVRGPSGYGVNEFVDNGDGTVTDAATGLMWQQADSGEGLNWQEALDYAERLTLAGHSDWRLPNAKELQSIVDYARSPDTTGSAAIDPILDCTRITNEAGQADFGYYWSGTTHVDGPRNWGACYVSFGRAMGYMRGTWMDVHGAGAQRSDPKSGDPADYPYGFGPQGDARRVYNMVRCVREAD